MSDGQNRDRVTEREGLQPSDTERLVGDTAASEPLTTSRRVQPGEAHMRGSDAAPEQGGTGSEGGSVRTDGAAARDEQLGHS